METAADTPPAPAGADCTRALFSFSLAPRALNEPELFPADAAEDPRGVPAPEPSPPGRALLPPPGATPTAAAVRTLRLSLGIGGLPPPLRPLTACCRAFSSFFARSSSRFLPCDPRATAKAGVRRHRIKKQQK